MCTSITFSFTLTPAVLTFLNPTKLKVLVLVLTTGMISSYNC